MKREEKEISFKASQLVGDMALATLCYEHNIEMLKTGTVTTLRLTESSTDLPGFADAVERHGILARIDVDKRAAYIADLATLECP